MIGVIAPYYSKRVYTLTIPHYVTYCILFNLTLSSPFICVQWLLLNLKDLSIPVCGCMFSFAQHRHICPRIGIPRVPTLIWFSPWSSVQNEACLPNKKCVKSPRDCVNRSGQLIWLMQLTWLISAIWPACDTLLPFAIVVMKLLAPLKFRIG